MTRTTNGAVLRNIAAEHDRHVLQIHGDEELCPTARDFERILEHA